MAANQFEIPGLEDSIKNLKVLDKNVEDLIKHLLKVAIEGERAMAPFKNTAGVKAFNDAQKESAKTTDLVAKANERLKLAESEKGKQLAEIGIKIQRQNQLNKESIKLHGDEASALDKLNAQINKSTRESKELGAQMVLLMQAGKGSSQEYAEVAKKFDEASAKSKLLNDSYRTISKSAGDNRALVGSYSDELKDHFDKIGGGLSNLKNSIQSGDITGIVTNGKAVIQDFGGAMKKTTEVSKAKAVQEKATGAAIKSSTVATQGNSVAMATNTVATDADTASTTLATRAKAAWAVAINFASTSLGILRVALISTGIGALIVVLGSLIAYFTSTQEGIDKITSVTRPLRAIFESLIGVAQNLGKMLVDTFSNPKKAMNDLYEFVKNNLINRFKAFGVILDGIINLDFKKVTDGVLQGATGVENLTGKIAGASAATGKFLSDAAAKGRDLDNIQKDIEKSQLKFNRNTIAVNDALDEQLLISKDTSKTFAERKKASDEIIRLTKQQGDEEAKIIEKKIRQLQLQQSLNDTSREGNQQMIDLEIQLDAAKDRGIEAEKEQLRVQAGARKEAAKEAQEAAKERIAKAKEAADREKEAAQKVIENQKKAMDLVISTKKNTLDFTIANYKQEQNASEDNLAFARTVSLQKQEIANLEQQKNLKGLTKGSLDYRKVVADNSNEIKKIKAEETKAIEDIEKKSVAFELELYDFRNQTLIDNGEDLTDILVEQEKSRLLDFQRVHLDALAKDLKIDEEKLKAKIKNNQKLSENDLKYLQGKQKLEKDTNDAIKKNAADLVKAKEKMIDEETKREQKKYKDFSKFSNLFNVLQLKSEKKNLDDKRKIENRTASEILEIDKNLAENKIELDQAVSDSKKDSLLMGLDFIQEMAGRESEIGKALAVARITMDTIEGATKAFKLGHILLADP